MQQASFSPIELMKESWHKTKGAKATFWGVLVICILVQMSYASLGKAIRSSGAQSFSLWLLEMVLLLSLSLLQMGLVYLGIRRARNEAIAFNQINHVFKFNLFLKFIAVIILQGISLILPFLVITTAGSLISPFLAFIVAICVNLFIYARIFICNAIVIDEGFNPWHAYKTSFRDSKNNVWPLLGLILLNIFILLVSMIPFGIGLIWSLPYVIINYGDVYRVLHRKSTVIIEPT